MKQYINVFAAGFAGFIVAGIVVYLGLVLYVDHTLVRTLAEIEGNRQKQIQAQGNQPPGK